jgi:hypothetical protein
MRPKLTYANVVATLALFIALGGTSVAAMTLAKNSVKSSNIGKEQVKASDIAKSAVDSTKVKDASLLAGDFKSGQLPTGATGAKGPQGPKGLQGIPGLSGLERVYTTGVSNNSDSPKITVATCAPGKSVISGGYDISGGKEGVTPNGLANILADVVEPSNPSPGSTGSLLVEAWEEDATADTWGVSAIALCANVAP